MIEPTLYLVDGSGFIFRAYHALPPLTTKAGVPSGAVYGFTQMLLKLELEHRPSHLAVVFDAGGHSQREALYPEYKANRTEPPDDLKPQFAAVRRVVDAFGIPRLEATDCEADDLIATLTRAAEQAGLRVVIVSSDKDLMQLVDDRCVLIDTMKDPPKVYDAAAVTEKFGVPPAQLADVLALMGDSVDNVPGVPGVGPKTAAALIQHFGSVDALLGRLPEVAALKGLRGAASVQGKVAASADALRLSRRLVELDLAVPFDRSVGSLERHPPDMAKVEALLKEYEFYRLIERLRAAPGETARPQAAAGPAPAPERTVEPTPELDLPVEIVGDARALAARVEALRAAPRLGVGVYGSSLSPMGAALVGISLAAPGQPPIYVPVAHRYLGAPPQLESRAALELLAPLLGKGGPPKHVVEAKEAELLLARHGAPLAGVASDPGLAAFLLEPLEDHALAALAARHLGRVVEGREALCGAGKRALPYDTIEVARAARYAGGEAAAALHLGPRLLEALTAAGQDKLFVELELPLVHVLAAMERHGVCVDVAHLKALSADVERQLAALEEQVRASTGSEVNLGSPKQLQELLFDKLGLPPSKRTKTGFSVDAEVLEELAPLHPAAAKILEHRTLAKLKGTYLDALPALVDPRTGRLHTSYKQAIAATGRLSSVDPNLQNVPVRTELGREIRRAFHAAQGCLLVVADYSQIELRVLAHLSEDPVLLDAFQRDQDIHQRTVLEMFGAGRAADPELRRVAKMINYGIVYGLSDFGLAQRLGIERADAKRYIDGYLATYAGVARYMNRLVEEAYREGGSRTLLGRFRPLPELKAKNRTLRQAGERMARNTPIQGTAADLLKLAMIRVQRLLEGELPGVKMLLTVHDELVLEAPEPTAETAGQRLRELMEGVMPLRVPLKVDLGLGRSWADAK